MKQTSVSARQTGLAKLIADHELTQRAVAQLIGVSPDRLSKTINGKRRLTGSEARLLAKALNIALDDVLNAVGDAVLAVPTHPSKQSDCEQGGNVATVIEYVWPDGHRVTIESTRVFDDRTLKRIRGLLDLTETSE